jgi:TolB-like protein
MVIGVCLPIGCGDDSTAPERKNPPPSKELTHSWSDRFGDNQEQCGRAVAVDASGNIIVVGYMWGTVDFGGGPRTSAHAEDIFVAKFGPDGTHIWSERFGGQYSQEATCVAVDGAGNVIVSGRFNGDVDFGGGGLSGRYDVFVAKFAPDGTHIWSDGFGDVVIQEGWGVGADAAGNIIVAGRFYGTVDFGGGALTATGSSDDIFVVKFAPDGTHIWSDRFGDGEEQSANDVAVDGSGNVIITGELYGQAYFGGDTLTSSGRNDVFVAKLDPDGGHVWSKRFGDSDEQSARGIAVDPSGNVVIGGHFTGTVNFGGGSLTDAGMRDAFVAKFDPNGGHLWSDRFGDAYPQELYGVCADAAGRIILAGSFDGTMDFGGDPLPSAGSYDAFIARFSASGTHLWSQSFGDAAEQYVFGTAAAATGDAVITGQLDGTVDFGGGALTTAGGGDVFVAKFEP